MSTEPELSEAAAAAVAVVGFLIMRQQRRAVALEGELNERPAAVTRRIDSASPVRKWKPRSAPSRP